MNVKLFVFTAFLLSVAVSTPTNTNIFGKLKVPANLGINANKHEEPVGLYGGRNVTINKVKYIGSILDQFNELKGSAVILNNKWIVTAAWNFYGVSEDDVTVRVGSSYSDKGGSVFDVAKIVRHPKYVGQWDYDIALAKLKKPLKFSGVTQKTTIASSLPKNGASGLVSGYGWTETTYGGFLQEANIPYLSYESCKSYYQESDFTKYSLCTSKEGVGPCAYDFGSPLIYKNKLIGIFSGTYACGSTTYPGVYADATKFTQWIKSTIKKNSDPEDELLDDEEDVAEEELA